MATGGIFQLIFNDSFDWCAACDKTKAYCYNHVCGECKPYHDDHRSMVLNIFNVNQFENYLPRVIVKIIQDYADERAFNLPRAIYQKSVLQTLGRSELTERLAKRISNHRDCENEDE